MKDGIHLMWPCMVTPWVFHKKVRDYVVNHFKNKKINMFTKMKIENTISEIFDLSIISRNNWLMYGSSKPGKEPYLLTKIYKYEDGEINEIPIDKTIYSDLNLIKLCSIRNRYDNRSMFQIEKSYEIMNNHIEEIKIKAQKKIPSFKKIGPKQICTYDNLDEIFRYIDMLDKISLLF